MLAPANPPMTCTDCKQKAILACAGCISEPSAVFGISETTWYCELICQKADWNKHKEICKPSQARRSLYRAGDIVQHIFYIYREKVFDKLVLSVERSEDHVRTAIRFASGQDKFFVPFPDQVCFDHADKQALLACWACADALAYMHGLVKNLLRGLYKEIRDVVVSTKNHRRSFINADTKAPIDNTKYGHEIFQITLKNGEKYALDIAGAQYGQFETVLPWDVYVRLHVKKVLGRHDFGCTHKRMTSSMYCDGSTDIQLKKNFNKLLSESMDAQIKKWQCSGITLPAMLRLPEQIHLQKRDDFFAYLNSELDKAKLDVLGKLSGRAREPATGVLFKQWLRFADADSAGSAHRKSKVVRRKARRRRRHAF